MRRRNKKPGPKPSSRRTQVHAVKLEPELIALVRALVPLTRTTHGTVAGRLYAAWVRAQLDRSPALLDELTYEELDHLDTIDNLYPDKGR